MRDEWEPKPFDFYTAERWLIGALIVTVLVSVLVGVSQWPAAVERSAEYETSMQETMR